MKDLSKPIERLDRTVAPEQSGERLDHVLAAWITWRSRSDLQKRIRAGTVLVNGKPVKSRTKVFAGDVITVMVENPGADAVDPDGIPIVVLHEERTFVVLDKPPGVVMHPVGKHVYDTLMNVLHARYKRDFPELDVTPMVVHRLDRDTSGVLLIAKEEDVRKRLGAAFEGRDVEKEYLALVFGRIDADTFTVNQPIGPDPLADNKTKMACIPDGRASYTEFAVVERFARATLVRCFPKTGRQHQIRVHLAHTGHPILGDALYAEGREPTAAELGLPGSPDARVLDRQALHAARLVIPHPTGDGRLSFESPLAADLTALVDRLRAASI
jgi:23S rRNA pseudouridine1911/1915/1917 synthase